MLSVLVFNTADTLPVPSVNQTYAGMGDVPDSTLPGLATYSIIWGN